MRDAFGGAFMIKLFLVFIFLYICLTALALNYAKAFRVKNAVIEYLEKNEIADLSKMNASELMTMEDFFETEIVGVQGYSLDEHSIACSSNEPYEEDGVWKYCHSSGVEITQSRKVPNTEGIYYTVSTYMDWSIPFLNMILELDGNTDVEETPSGVWKISGETRLIVHKEIEG